MEYTTFQLIDEHGGSGGNIECEGDEAIATTKERSDADCNDPICNDITHDHEYTTTPKISTAYLGITSFSIAHLDHLMIPEFLAGAYEERSWRRQRRGTILMNWG